MSGSLLSIREHGKAPSYFFRSYDAKPRRNQLSVGFLSHFSQVDRLQMAHFFRSYDAIPFHFAITMQMTWRTGFGRADLGSRTQSASEYERCACGRHL